MTKGIMIRQGGLRFHWTQGTRRVDVRDPDGGYVGTLLIGDVSPLLMEDDPELTPATLDEVQDAVDAYCTQL